MGWGNFLDRITSWLPIQTKKERIRNKIEKLQKEKEKLINSHATPDLAKKVEEIERQLNELYKLAKND